MSGNKGRCEVWECQVTKGERWSMGMSSNKGRGEVWECQVTKGERWSNWVPGARGLRRHLRSGSGAVARFTTVRNLLHCFFKIPLQFVFTGNAPWHSLCIGQTIELYVFFVFSTYFLYWTSQMTVWHIPGYYRKCSVASLRNGQMDKLLSEQRLIRIKDPRVA